MNRPVRVLQVVDSLAAGGSERMAVRLANGLVGRVELSALCTTRLGGPLRSDVDPEVTYLELGRSSTVDVRAALRLRKLIDDLGVTVVHAHSSSVFLCAAALALRRPRPVLVLHDHNSRLSERQLGLTRIGGRLSDVVFAVSDDIAEWNRQAGVGAEKVKVVANFVDESALPPIAPELPGHSGARVVMVGNLRPEKNHLRLVRSFANVVSAVPDAHLLLVGSHANAGHTKSVQAEIENLELDNHVTLLGVRADVPSVLAGCDVAVLPSLDEGCPLALIEYGLAGLPTVATPVGQVPEVTGFGTSATLVDPLEEQAIAAALIDLLSDEGTRHELGRRFSASIRARYSASVVLPEVVGHYVRLVGADPGHDHG